MPRFDAFAGIRYATDDLAAVTAPPYDVIDDAERTALEARHPHNVVHLDLPPGSAAAGAWIRRWLADGVLAVDGPSLYLYGMTPGGGQPTLGVIGALGL